MRENHVYSFEKLIVWQKAREFVVLVYSVTKKFPNEEQFGLTNQIRRAAVSIASNLAEGCSRSSAKDQARFTQIAYGSLMEVLSHFYLAHSLGFCKLESVKIIKEKIFELSNLLNSLRNNQLKRNRLTPT